MDSKAFDEKLTDEEVELLMRAAGPDHTFEVVKADENTDKSDGVPEDEDVPQMPDTQTICSTLARTVLDEGPDAFVQLYEEHEKEIEEAAFWDEDVKRVLLACFKVGIEQENGFCACDLGGCYYTGSIFEQDYRKAADLYERGAAWGCRQAMINLGYIYEYGRIGEPDYERAFKCYATVAASGDFSEALYKLGDMYARGQAVPENKQLAYDFWKSSYDVAEDIEERCQPAFRMAGAHLDPDAKELYGCSFSPLNSLVLYQQAEVGLRISVKKGMYYYEERLQQAIEGQAAARALLDQQ